MSKRPASPPGIGSTSELDKAPCKSRLLLHAVDGCVPYLTPSLLETHFPPSDDLWIGLAVRDTSVIQIYDDPTDEANRRKTSKKKSTGRSNKDGSIEEVTPKVKGYTFGGVHVDPWLEPYSRLTVPSFDLVKDASVQQQQQQLGAGSENHVLVWTPHGRQTLTVELYALASEGLNSQHTLALYDMSKDNKRKRQERAQLNTQALLRGFLKKQKEASTFGSVWAPVLLAPNDNEQPNDVASSALRLDHIKENLADITGVALIGNWRSGMEEKLASLVNIPTIALLSTCSLSSILDALASNVINLIGTDLPTRWAKEKKAFVVDYCPSDGENQNKRPRRSKDATHDGLTQLDSDGCIDLHDKRFARDARPLVSWCNCMSCNESKFTRAYIHHLVCAKEMVAEVLLFGHNLHCLLELFRNYATSGNPEKLMDYIRGQLQQ